VTVRALRRADRFRLVGGNPLKISGRRR
jgi:hypothetical protein